ncbi:MAG: TonB-dependent receptor [Nitrospiraceae bacterium]|nr:MAG: TonB-dependent receptor [Nitrospiraceae bacterium]
MKHIIMNMVIILLSSWTIQAAQDETIKVGEVVVTASRYEEALSTVPTYTNVIDKDAISNSTSSNIPDLLRAAGLHVNDVAGNKRNMTVDIRGFGETAGLNTLVLVDGRPVNQADLSGTDWSQIPLDRVEKIEIVRGGQASILYGDNATGGVINIITREGDALRYGAGFAAGSYLSFKENAFISNSTDKLSYSLSGSHFFSDGYRDNSETAAKDLGMNLNYYAADFIKLNLSTGYHNDETGLPGALKESDFSAGASRTDTINPDDFADVTDYYVKGGPEVYFRGDSFFKLDASYRKRTFLTFASFVGGTFLGDTEIKTTSVNPQLLIKNKIGKSMNTLTLGYDFQEAKEDIENDSSFSGLATFDLNKKNHGYYVHNEIRLIEHLVLSGGYRHDKAEFSFRPSTPDEATMDEDLFTGGLNYNFYNQSYAYVSYAKSFRYPVLDELFNFITNSIDTTLTPQTSDDYEIGLRHYVTKTSYAQINVFRIETDDEILYNPTGGSFGFGANENLDGKTRRDGVEFAISMQPVEWIQLNAHYTYMEATVRGGQYKDKDIPNVPKHRTSFNSVFSPGHGVTIALNGVYIGTRPFISDFSNSFKKQEDYFVLNGKIKYQWKTIAAFVDLNNLMNKEYSEFGTLSLFSFPVESALYPSLKFNTLFGLSIEI